MRASISRQALRWLFLGALLSIWAGPVILLLRIPPGIVAASLGFSSVILYSCRGRIPPRRRAGATTLTAVLVIGAAILGVVHASGLLDPLLSLRGDLEVAVQAVVQTSVEGGERVLSYSIRAANLDDRAASGRTFSVDGRPHRGVLLYGMLSRIRGGAGDVLPGAISAVRGGNPAHRIVYAAPSDITVSPTDWAWSTAFRADASVIGLLTGDGSAPGGFAGGMTLELQYRVEYPPAVDPIYHKHAALSYEFRWLGVASYHDPWFGFVDPGAGP